MFPIAPLFALFEEHADRGIAVALSGGVDSALLLTCLAEFQKQHPCPVQAITITSPLMPPEEKVAAQALAASVNLPWRELAPDLLELPAVKTNAPDRCYHCKYRLFTRILEVAKEAGIKTVMDGTHASDSPMERPGMRALRELQILSPFALCGITKEMIRAEALRRNLAAALKPAAPCLATRFPPNTGLNPEALDRVCKAEQCLRADLPKAADFRIRVWGNVAVLELAPEDFPLFETFGTGWKTAVKALGYRDLLLHPDGLQSGRLTPPPDLKECQ